MRQENLLGNAAPGVLATTRPKLTGVSIDGPINILLVGVDTRPDWTSGSHSDTIIIVHIPASHDRAYLVSLPRDAGVAIPADPATGYPGGYNKINAAFTFGSRNGKGYAGGFQLLANTIKQDYGITFNGGAIIDFNGFKDIVDKLGGVNMYVDETTISIHHGYINGDPSQHAAPYNINPNTGVPYCPHGGTFNSTPLKCAITGCHAGASTRRASSICRPTTRWTTSGPATAWSAPTTRASGTSSSSSRRSCRRPTTRA